MSLDRTEVKLAGSNRIAQEDRIGWTRSVFGRVWDEGTVFLFLYLFEFACLLFIWLFELEWRRDKNNKNAMLSSLAREGDDRNEAVERAAEMTEFIIPLINSF